MPDSCVQFRTNLDLQTPVYDKAFVKDYTPLESPVVGRHESVPWTTGTGDTHIRTSIHLGYPDLTGTWKRLSNAECGDSACEVPRTFITMGTDRHEYFQSAKDLQSQIFCLTQLELSTNPAEQMMQWMREIKKLPMIYLTDFIRVNAAMQNDFIQIARDDFATLVPDDGAGGNITGQLTTINLGATANLPQSRLTWPYIQYLMENLRLEGYFEAPSGLPANMVNLITDQYSWFHLTNGRPELKNMMCLDSYKDASPLYKIGVGISEPFGNVAPTIDPVQLRFQHMGNGVLNRVEPYLNTAFTTGRGRTKNPAWINAKWGMSFLWHPMAIRMHMPEYNKLRNELIPSIMSSMYGQWHFKNGDVLKVAQPDGTECTLQNDKNLYFYWLVAMRAAFEFQLPQLLMPILHQLDGSGKCETVNDPTCCDDPQYVAQTYDANPLVCEA